MPIQMKKPGDSSFELTIEDRFDPDQDYIVEVVSMDTGDYVSKLDGKPYIALHWNYRIYDSDGIALVDEVSGAPWEGRAFSSMSLAGRAKARMWASAFIGHELTDAECDKLAENFDGVIVGKRARVSFKLEPKKGEGGEVLGHNLTWALLRAMPKAQPQAAKAAPKAQASTPTPTPSAPRNGAASAATETPAQRRARLQADLAAMDDDQVAEDGADDDRPF